jgi:hypothetical protein
MIITPAIAQQWLDNNNTHNRHLSEKRVEAYAQAMRDEKWIPNTNDDITFDENDILTNGQHRLKAITKSGVSIECFVKFGVPHNPYMDKGLQRTDVSSLELFSDLPKDIITKDTIALATFILPHLGFSGSVTLPIKEDFLKYFKVEIQNFLKDVRITHCRYFSANHIFSALFVAYINGVPATELQKFYDILRKGIAGGDIYADIIFKFRNWQINNNSTSTSNKMEAYARCQAAIYGYVQKDLKMNPGNKKKVFTPVYPITYNGITYPR